jgi:hypothetical protein
MEMVCQYLRYDPLWNPSIKWGYRYGNNTSITFTEKPIQKPQELAQKYLNIQSIRKNTSSMALWA